MKKAVIIIVSLLCLCRLCALSQSVLYNLANVPEQIKNKASVIMHSENIELEIESTDKVTLTDHKMFTVVNEDGRDWLEFGEYSNQFMSLEEVEIKMYDANGKQLGKYKKRDMSTVAAGEGLIPDGYVTHFKIPALTYPITIDVQYEKRIKSTLTLPDYRFIEPEEGVIESNCTVKVRPDIGFRYKARNTSIEPVITDEGKYKIYRWSVKNLPPLEREAGSVAANTRYPHITFVTDRFSFLGTQGDLSSWRNLGTWVAELYKGLDVLPANRQQFFADLVKDVTDDKEKTARIYHYLQRNFRYVSIQLGIGGFRPFSAEFTDQKKYGDCKALSNYMKAALKSVGIKSYLAIINAEYNQEPVDPNFPANEFNHVILCVPGQKDSIWLECTSSTTEFGELGTFTENRNALLITEEGGILVPTPKSHSDENVLATVSIVTISNDLSGLIETIFTTKGEYRTLINGVLGDSRDDQKQTIVHYFGFKQPDDFTLAKDESVENKATLKMAITKVPEFNAGNKLFIPSRMSKMWSRNLPKAENRKTDFYFSFPFEKKDTTIFKFPAGMKPDVLPKETELKCNYAFYKTKYWYSAKENSVYAVTFLTLRQHKIPASDYASIKKFFDDIALDDAQKMVVQKSGE